MSITDELLRLDRLREDGVLTADDFMQAMANMLAGCPVAGVIQQLACPRPPAEAERSRPAWRCAVAAAPSPAMP